MFLLGTFFFSKEKIKKEKKEKEAPYFVIISYKALVAGHDRSMWSELCDWFGGMDWAKALGGNVLLCFVYRLPAHAR